jgi:hypothetical protein
LLAKGACRNRLAGLIGVGASLLAKGACHNRLAGFASKVREQARSYPAPVILQFSKLTGGKGHAYNRAAVRKEQQKRSVLKVLVYFFNQLTEID